VEHRLDPWLLLATLAVVGVSLATLASLDWALALRQATWFGVGLALMVVVAHLDNLWLGRAAATIWLAAVAALAAVLVFGTVRGGTRGWFALGPLTLQPSEFGRLAALLAAAAVGARSEGPRLRAGSAAAAMVAVAVPVALVLAEPDLGVALTYLPVAGAVLLVGGLPRGAWVAILLAAAVAAGAGWRWGLAPYQRERVLTVLDPGRDPYGTGYQVRQSKIAVGSGRLTGAGLGRGSQSSLHFLPARHTDFALAVWAEGTGFAGVVAVLGAYALLLGRAVRIGLEAEDRLGLLLVAGVVASLGFQVAVNAGMVVGLAPITGITLPLVSYGGSSVLATLAALGLVHGQWRQRLVNR